jgi:hypothetical protein
MMPTSACDSARPFLNAALIVEDGPQLVGAPHVLEENGIKNAGLHAEPPIADGIAFRSI